MMLPIVSIVGKSGAGKTFVVTRLVTELKSRGYRVATVKHSVGGFDLDREGKDSWHHAQAGSDAVSISSPNRFAVIRSVDHDTTLAEIPRLVGLDFDIIVAEGFSQDSGPKIEVHRKELGPDMICNPEKLMAVATDGGLEVDLPKYAPDDAAGLADLVERELLSRQDQGMIALYANGEAIPLNSFASRVLSSTILGLVSPLKGVDVPASIDISIRRKAQ